MAAEDIIIKLKRGVSGGAAPAGLTHGELAINTTDVRLYVGSLTGSVLSINNRFFTGATAPDYPVEGDRWYNGSYESVYISNTWQAVGGSTGSFNPANLLMFVAGASGSGGITFSGNFTITNNLGGTTEILNGLTVVGGITGSILTATQPNITLVGILSSLTASGLISANAGLSANNLFVTNGATFGSNIYAPNMVTGVNGITGAVSITSGSNITITQSGKQITIAAAATPATLATSSVTGVASFRAADFDVSVTGSVSLTGTVARTNVSQTFTGLQTFDSGISANGITGTLLTSTQPNITLLGSLSALTAANVQISSGGLSVTGGIAGTIVTASQPNITTVGVLDGLSVNNGLSVTGGMAITGAIVSFGGVQINSGGLSVTGGARIQGQLTVTGVDSLAVFGGFRVANGVSITGGMDVTGGARVFGTFNAGDGISVTGQSRFIGNPIGEMAVSISGGLSASGNTELRGLVTAYDTLVARRGISVVGLSGKNSTIELQANELLTLEGPFFNSRLPQEWSVLTVRQEWTGDSIDGSVGFAAPRGLVGVQYYIEKPDKSSVSPYVVSLAVGTTGPTSVIGIVVHTGGMQVTGDSSFNQNLTIRGNLTVLGTYPGGGGGGATGVTLGVWSLNGITGDVSITSGSNVTITQSGKQITIASSGGGGNVSLATSSVTGVASFRAADFDVSTTGSVSLTSSVARTNVAQTFSTVQGFAGGFTAAGATFTNAIFAPNMVTGVNGITGAVTITSGSNITISQTGKQITIAALAAPPTLATSSVTGVASFRAADFTVSSTGSVSLTSNVARTNVAQTFSTVQGFAGGLTAQGATFSNMVYSESGFEIGSSSFNRLSSGYILAPSDDGKVIVMNSPDAVSITGGTAIGYTGFSCTIIQLGVGQVTISPSSVTINSFNLANKLSGQHAAATLLCYATNTFNLSGNIVL